MKKLILSFLFLCAQLSLSAQFLKKLSDKAGAAVEKTIDKGLGNGENAGGSSKRTAKAPAAGEAMPSAVTRPSASPQGGSSSTDGTWSAADYGTQPFKLEPGETIVRGEFSLKVSNTGQKINLITSHNGKYFFYENGTRTGPFDRPPLSKLGVFGFNSFSASTRQSNPSKFIEGTGNVRQLVLNGKKYGPFSTILAFYLSPDQERFYALAEKRTGESSDFFLLSHSGTTKLPGYAPTLLVSNNFEHAAAVGSQTQLKARTEQDRYRYAENDDTFVFTSTGAKLGPLKDWNRSKNWISNNGMLIQLKEGSRKQIYINGEPGPSFQRNLENLNALFLSKSGKSGAYYDYGSLYFSDGTHLAYSVLSPAAGTENGKDYLFWLSVKDNNLYVCRKEI